MRFELARYKAAVFDLDGTVWLSDTPMPGAIEFVGRCRELGLSITFATNATSIAVDRLAELLIACGLASHGDGVVTGGSVVARSLHHLGVRQVVAEVPPAMQAAIESHGVEVLETDSIHFPDGWETLSPERAVVLGAHRGATFGRVELVGRLANLGHPLYVTSLDPGFPASGRMEPGGGMLVAALRALYDVTPTVMAKPSIQYADAIREAAGHDGPFVMFGDSQRADIGTAALLGADGVLITPAGLVDPTLPRPQYVTTGLHAAITAFEPQP